MIHPTFAIRLPEQLQAAMRSFAYAQGRTITDVATEAMEGFLAAQGAPQEVNHIIKLRPGRRKQQPWPDDALIIIDDDVANANPEFTA
jgi:hypothetical protein